MNRLTQGIFLVFLLLGSSAAYALDGTFYTHEGFSQTVNAFKVLSLIFHDRQFQVLIGVFATIGLFSGGFISFIRAVFAGGQSVQSAIGWLFLPLAGCIVYQGLVFPKGNIHIYDKVSNQHQTIGNIPNLLILVASGFNSIEEGLRNLVSKNTASPYAKEISGVSFKLFYNTMMMASNTSNLHYTNSIKRFYDDCMPVSKACDPNFDLDRLLKNTENIFDELQHLWHPSIFTVFSDSNQRGKTVSCTEARDKLFQWVNTPANFQDNFIKICKRQGFSDPKQIPACKREIAKGASLIFNRPVSADMLLRNAIFAHNIAKSLTDEDPDMQVGAYSNRKIINSGLASATSAQTWMPTIKATMTAIVLSLMPFLVLFFVTPLFSKALVLVFSLFAWLTIWGVCDAILHQSAIDQMISAFESVRAHSMGLWALWTAPTAAIKALAIMAQSRTMAATIAGLVGSAICGFSFHAFSGASNALTGRVESEANAAADRTLEPERAADYMEGIARANAVTNTVGRQGWGAFQRARTLEESQRVARAQVMTRGGGDYGGTGQLAGTVEGAEWDGRTTAMAETGQGIETVARQTAHTETSQRIGNAQGVLTTAGELKQVVRKMQQNISQTETHQRQASATVAQEINQQIAAHNPDNSVGENWHQQSLLSGGSQAKAIAKGANWNSDNLQNVLDLQTQGNVSTTLASQEVAENMGLTYPDMTADFARWEAMNQLGKNLATEKAAELFGMSHQEYANHVGYGGSIQNLSLTPEHLKSLHERDKDKPLPLVPEHIYEMYKHTGLVLNGVLSRNGNLIKSDWNANTTAGKTITIDNSVSLGNAAAARRVLANVDQVNPLIDQKGLEPLYEASAKSLQPIINSNHSDSLSKNFQGGGSVNFDKIPWLKLSAGGSINKQWGDQTVTDALYGNFSAFGHALERQADHQKLEGNARTEFLAKHYANINAKVQQHVDLAARTGSHGSSVESPFEQYLKNHELAEAQKAFKKGGIAPEPPGAGKP